MEKVKAYLDKIDDCIKNGTYKDNWQSLSTHMTPNWYKNAKFGIFVHWGVYSVPAYGNEWYPREMYNPGTDMYRHHLETYGFQKRFGYKDFVPLFKGEKFDPAKWAELFAKAGAKFVMPVAEYHDGFQMYDSDLSNWCATKMGPKRDVLGLLAAEIEKHGMAFSASSHRAEHYWFLKDGKKIDADIPNEVPYGDLYWPSIDPKFENYGNCTSGFDVDSDFCEDWLARSCEIVDKYHPKIMYFDWWIEVEPFKPYLKKFAAYYYNRALQWGEEVAITYKNDAFMFNTAVMDLERGQLTNISPNFWQNDTSVTKNSWCYTEQNQYRDPVEIVQNLIDVVSKNGALLLSIGPKADGTIPLADAGILMTVGRWLRTNGEGIYDTTYWKKYGEGPTIQPAGHFTESIKSLYTPEDFRFTFKNESLYIFPMCLPQDGVIRIKCLGKNAQLLKTRIKSVKMLGSDKEVVFKLCEDYLTIFATNTNSELPICLRLDVF